jgi:hypothetical protein
MEVANRFTDGEDAYNSKRARSPKYDGPSRKHNQRRRSRNKDSRTRGNQVAAGYERGDEEGDENIEYHKDNRRQEKQRYPDPSAEDILYGLIRLKRIYNF